MRKILVIFAIGLLVTFLPGLPSRAAERGLDAAGGVLQEAGERTGLEGSFDVTASTLIQGILGIVGAIFLILMVYAGILWMSAQGNETRIEKAKNILIAAIIGIVITTMSYAITSFVLDELAGSGEVAEATPGT